MNKEQLRMKQIMDAMNTGVVQTDELAEVVKTLLSVMKELRIQMESEMMKGDKSILMTCEKMMSEMTDMEKKMMDMMKSKVSTAEMEKAVKSFMGEIETIKRSMPSMPDLSVYEAKLSEIEASIPVIKETILDNPLQIRDKLESIVEEEEKLSISAIENLRKELDELRKNIGKAKGFSFFGGGGSSGGGRTVSVYDLSSSLNGVLKTFSLPGFWKIILITSSSFPYVFRPTIDFTTSGSTITFTSEIEASTTLNTGQTLLVTYAE